MLGLTSISFRGKSCAEIIRMTKTANLDGIEWGGDVHVPPNAPEWAVKVGEMTREAGLKVLSYGSYYRLCQGADFHSVLQTAQLLGAPMIRIWAGNLEKDTAVDSDYEKKAIDELRYICGLAQKVNVKIGLEYHRWTLTWHSTGTCSLLNKTGADNLYTYWQPNPDISHSENCRELEEIKPWLSNFHVFQWEKGDIRYPLYTGESVWRDYYHIAAEQRQNSLIEFVQGNSEEQFYADAKTLVQWEKSFQ